MVDESRVRDWVGRALSTAVATHGQDSSGRIFASLNGSFDTQRQELARLMLSTLGQHRNDHFKNYLDFAYGVTPSEPSPAASDQLATPTRQEYIRPNGEKYFSRIWGTYEDVAVLRKAQESGQQVLLVGDPGTGKTAMAEAAFGEDLITVVITGDTEVSGLVGSFIPDPDGGYFWVDGPLLTAVKEGRRILIDEILLADSKVLAVLYPLMDGRGFLDVDANPAIGKVWAKEGFYIIGAGNPNVPGAKMSEALVSRFPIQVEVTTDYDLAIDLGVPESIATLASSLATMKAHNGTVQWAPQMRELLAYKKAEETWGSEFAMRNLLRICPEQDRAVVVDKAQQFIVRGKVSAAKI